MITCILRGGLGNQLFQIFTTISYAKTLNQPWIFLESEQLGDSSVTIRPTYWKSFLIHLRAYLVAQLPSPMVTIKENGFPYSEFPLKEGNCILDGNFQSYKYFIDHYDSICELIHLKEWKEIVSYMGYFDISMHFRMGDYKHLQHVHPLATYEYYEKALAYIDKKGTVLYFCEDNDIEQVFVIIEKLKEKYIHSYTFIRANNTLPDWKQLLLMSLCNHNIIANSTFSWWGAYFNTWSNKIVCYPSVWFGPSAPHNTKDLCPPEWTQIK